MEKNICFYLTRYPGYGGIETVTSIIINRLCEIYPEWNIIVIAHLNQETNIFLSEKIKIYHLSGWNLWPHNYKWNNSQFKEELLCILQKEKIDTIIYQDSYAPTEDLLIKLVKHLNIRFIVFEHNTPLYFKLTYSNRDNKTILSKLYYPYALIKVILRKRKLYKSCDKYVVLAESYIKEFCSLTYIRNKNKILYINNPFVNLNSDVSISFKENIILFVGRLNRVKRVDLMLSAWQNIVKDNPSWRFICVGDGEQRSLLEMRVKLGHIQNVEFCGFQQPLKYYAKSKIFWMMSSFEGWPMTLMEAMSYGCVPIVYNSFSSLNDIVDDSQNGFIVENLNENMFISKTNKLISNGNLLEYYSENARKKVQKFHVNLIIKHWESLLS